MDTVLYDKESLKVTCVPNKYCSAIVTSVLTVNGYTDDAHYRRIDAGFQCQIDVRNTYGKLFCVLFILQTDLYFLADLCNSFYMHDPLNPSQV